MMLAQEATKKVKNNSFHGEEVSAPLHRRACTGACAFFVRGVACIQTGVLSTVHAKVVTLNRCCLHQRTYLRTRSLQDLHMRSCTCSLFIQHRGTRAVV